MLITDFKSFVDLWLQRALINFCLNLFMKMHFILPVRFVNAILCEWFYLYFGEIKNSASVYDSHNVYPFGIISRHLIDYIVEKDLYVCKHNPVNIQLYKKWENIKQAQT